MKLLPQTGHLQINLHDFSYGKKKNILGNAVSKVLQIFWEEARFTNVSAKQKPNLVVYVLFVVKVSRLNVT